MKTMEDAKVDMSTALAWAVSAKNALQNVSGYSPNQLVFGMNVNLLSVLTDRPPALESATSDIIRKKLAALHSAQQNFIKAESSERIRKALRHQVRTFSEELYETGDKVYFNFFRGHFFFRRHFSADIFFSAEIFSADIFFSAEIFFR
jgi:hypothetical protein